MSLSLCHHEKDRKDPKGIKLLTFEKSLEFPGPERPQQFSLKMKQTILEKK